MPDNTSKEEQPAHWGCPIWPQTFYARKIARSVKSIPDYHEASRVGCPDCKRVLTAVEKFKESWCVEFWETGRICKDWYAGKVVVTLFVDDEEGRGERQQGGGYFLSLGTAVGPFEVELS